MWQNKAKIPRKFLDLEEKCFYRIFHKLMVTLHVTIYMYFEKSHAYSSDFCLEQ